MQNDRKLYLYIAMSLDGYIAGKNDDLSFLTPMEKEGEDYGYAEFIKSIDTIIIGRKTYDKIMSMGIPYPSGDQQVYVITRTPRETEGKFTFYNNSPTSLVEELKSKPGQNIYCDGGAEIVTELLKHHLIDEIKVSIIPILLGDGIRLFKDGRPEQKLIFKSSKPYEKGLVQLHYSVVRN